VIVDWIDQYLMANVTALARKMSDHTPLVLNTGEHVVNRNFQFKLELSLLLKDDLKDVIMPIWKESAGNRSVIEE
jgi:hypothetical protein